MADPKTRDQVIAISNATADPAGLPRILPLACGIAESELRWDARRPTDPARDAEFWTDVSHGVWQQTVRWSREYRDWYTANGHPAAQFPGGNVVEAIGSLYYDVEHAARVAVGQLAGYYRPDEEDAVFKALCRYNWPDGDGAPKGPTQAVNYRRGIADAERILATTEAPMPPSVIVYEDFRDPAPAGRLLTRPKGIILHGSRSGKAGNPKDIEYLGTARYEQNNPDGLGWHATIGPGKVAVHLTPREWGWHARAASQTYLGVELAQATVDEPITDDQVAALADYIKTRVLPSWPDLPLHFPSHAEVEASGETGRRDGKTDVFPLGSSAMDDLRARLMFALGARPEPVAPYAVGPGILTAMQEHGDRPATDEVYVKAGPGRDQYSEAFGQSGSRYVWVPSLGRVLRFDPAA